ncbi:MAG: preprotein translocase subunit SecA [Pseudobdellovibrionaceae bacterium]|nr:preprotein translocase subunit SecA [Bdellovibrionales bacterium]USN49004.1 MAG: preprotein translocase subunit SecA [Pseudobdellovibrionaceae bacterium]
MQKLLTKIFGTKHERDMKTMRPIIERINSFEAGLKSLKDDALQMKTKEFKERLDRGEALDALLPEAFAVCREGGRRVLGMRHYDVQMIGGIVLNRGAIAEMKTGEGKTLVATLPLYLNALTGRGAHCVTVNDYLATRDAEWMGQLYNFLGLSVGIIVHGKTDRERKAAYGSDITYGTNNEFGFDYLRDNMKFSLSDYVQREFNFAIVDECDSILVDEARTPLIISGPSEESVDKYYEINKIIPNLQPEVHFTMEEKSKTVSLTEEGNAKVEELLGLENLYDAQNIQLVHHVYQGLKAHHLYKRDVDYMVRDGEVVIVDEFTGRLMPGRRWSDGLHQAVDAKEGVKIKGENQTLATITFQNFFRMYSKLAGMTGTAETEAVEFKKIYNLDVFVIPTNKPIARMDQDDVVYKTENGKFKAIVDDIIERKEKGQPVLVGTVSIEKSEKISRALKNAGITHNVLNAKQHEREAEIVAQAGRFGSVTIATNMAGRGTDIVLGGNPESMARVEVGDDIENQERFEEAVKKYKPQCEGEKVKVLDAGGLYIIGTERHESRRIDNQLRGRSGRQGDPGESRFYLSLEDNLMRIFNGERIQKIMNTLKVPEDEPIMAGMVSRAIEGAQRKVEGHNFDIRKHLLEYDDVMNKQRTVVYGLRRQVLGGEDLERLVLDMLGDLTSHILDTYASEESKPEQWDLQGMNTVLNQQFGVTIEFPQNGSLTSEKLTDAVSGAVKQVFDSQKQHLGEHFDEVVKMVLLQSIDTNWKEHLYQIDQIKEGINLRAYAQKDPLIEYKKEGFRLFESMNHQVQSEAVEKLFKIQLVAPEEAQRQMEMRRQAWDQASEIEYAGADDSGSYGFFQEEEFQQGPQNHPSAPGPGVEVNYNQGPGDQGQGRKLNRAERRRREKAQRRRK